MLPRGGGAYLAEMDGNLTCSKSDSLVSLHWQGKYRGPDFAPISFTLETVTIDHFRDSKGRLIPPSGEDPLRTRAGKAEAGSRHDEDALLLALTEHDRASMSGLARRPWLADKGPQAGARSE